MKKIITIGGSNSINSINKIFAEYTGELMKNVELIKIDLNDYNLPMFSIDVENEQGFSEDLVTLNKLFNAADGFVVSLAEHNGAYSTAFKNAFDWLSRVNGKVWRDKPMLLLTAAPGERGGITMLEIALGRFPYMGAKIVGSMSFPFFNDNFKNGKIVNEDLQKHHFKLVEDFQKVI
ncbi:NAD(P)H-dependent FMN reductase [Lutibacter oceani]|uniref:NAD(P)H-dependent FMN reductase n=1 Tax=Lutibacter oceani TaxID=1853311 RepID=A0A3D9RWT8_9FLAO|nr:NAD(P)H-dependent oxidoreductase [Lutibacter oceani]REE82261.1 NAD(P)H-dependent FMN reductase [Lutibacter oceani]